MPLVLFAVAMFCARTVLADTGGLRGTSSNGTQIEQSDTLSEQSGTNIGRDATAPAGVHNGSSSEMQAASWNASSEVLNNESYIADAGHAGRRRRSHNNTEDHPAGSNIKTAYHQTSSEIAAIILADGFKTGRGGWCGGGIYFALTPQATNTKAIAPSSHTGVVLEAKIDIGRAWRKDKTCDRHLTAQEVHKMGYDSVTFNPGDGDEYVLYSSNRVLSTKLWGPRSR